MILLGCLYVALGMVLTLAGEGSAGALDGPGLDAMFDRPSGVAVDTSENIFVADSDNNLIRMISPTGTYQYH